ncbi:cell division protein SepF [Lacicoccus alkaliphilus]|uniref:cell division protein SepF n=1 Tax=Lacicoccus alkaliphilus TaxID=148453 RepID=UPI001FE8D1A7|nr:cell division protein SepF [Salinicoccus alkaliphilus]
MEVEEESSGAEQQSKKVEAEVKNNDRQSSSSKVTRLDLTKNGSTETSSKIKKDEDDRQSRPFFKKEKTTFGRQAPKRKYASDKDKENTLMNTDDRNAKVHLFEPRVFSETQDIADELKNERATLVNLSKVDAAPKKRIVDFLSGTVYALNGDIQKVGSDIFLCTPKSVVVEGEISSDKENLEEM